MVGVAQRCGSSGPGPARVGSRGRARQRRLLLALALAVAAGCSAEARPPNIVFLLVDDLRWDEVAVEGDPIETPAIDRLAREGVRFENAFVTSSLCSPSRASFLTGTWPHVHGVVSNSDELDETRTPGLAALLHERGYRTAMIGKWHMGRVADRHPGYDRWFAMPGQGAYYDPVFLDEGTRVRPRGYSTDILTEEALAFLRESAHGDAPFFLHLAYKAVHQPRLAARRHVGRYARSEWPAVPGQVRVPQEWRRQDAETLMAVDESVAAIRAALEKLGILDRTVVIFTSDNGFLFGEHHLFDKRVFYEESIRIPWLMRYPPAIEAGSVRRPMVLNVDLVPTLLELAGAPVPASVQGRSLMPLLRDAQAPWRRSWLYEYFRELPWPQLSTMLALRTETHKYVTFPAGGDLFHRFDGEPLLFDLEADPHELVNLANDPARAALRAELEEELARLLEGVDVASREIERARFEARVGELAAKDDFFGAQLRQAYPDGWPPR